MLETSGVVRIVKDLDIDLSGRDVIVVEDIIDSGLTLNYLRKLESRGPTSLRFALLVRSGRQVGELGLKYVGFEIPPDFVIGYGLDVEKSIETFRIFGVMIHLLTKTVKCLRILHKIPISGWNSSHRY